MSDMFESYESDYNALSESLVRHIQTIPSLKGEQKKDAIRKAEKDIDECDELYQQMDLEARSLSPAMKSQLQSRMRGYKENIQRLKTDLRKATVAFAQADRDALFQGHDDYHVTSMDQRTRLLAATERLDDSTRRLDDTHSTVLQTEQLGVDILSTLHGQRQQLEGTRDNLRRADENIGRSGRILRSMARRVITNKIIIAFIILVLLASIMLIIYFKWIKKDSPKKNPNPAPSPNTFLLE